MLSVRLLHNYLSKLKQSTKIDSAYSSWEETNFDIPQGSLLGLFKAFLYAIYRPYLTTKILLATPMILHHMSLKQRKCN